VSSKIKPVFTAAKLAANLARLGREINRDYRGKTLDVVVIMDNAIVFAADLMRHITRPCIFHFVRAEIRDVELGGYVRKEIFFSPEPYLKGRDVLLLDAVLHTGVTMDFWARRLMNSKPKSLKIAVLIDRPLERKVDLKPDYVCLETASKELVGFGLPGPKGLYRNLPYVGALKGGKAPERKAQGRGRRRGR
jgi:hypoxanthine phosphoribosyltransferase